MSAEPLDEMYFQWLYEQVRVTRRGSRTKSYWSILRKLFTKEFVWIVPNDDNRVQDGRDLRYEFEESLGITADQEWIDLGCSVLEMMIGVARRICFETGRDDRYCFWELMRNLDFAKFTDDKPIPEQEVDEALDALVWRTYHPDGTGGLFPLTHPDHDQRLVEIWYQLQAYLLEREE